MTQETIGGYNIVGELGRGAMGVVYRAFDPRISRPVAIKVIRVTPEATAEESSQLRQRLIREASAAGKLSHPSIVTVYQLGEDGQNVFIAMEFVQGTSLGEAMRKERISPSRCIQILQQVAEGLDYAHKAGVVHRDIKPANILIREDGQAKIADFGIAKVIESATSYMTQEGTTLGSPSYMSPEQVRAAPLDGRSDQFSLAIVAFELLAGRKPFAADSTAALVYQIISADPLASPDAQALPAMVKDALAKALDKDSRNRFPTCAAFVRALKGEIDRPTVERAPARPANVPEPQNLPATETIAVAPSASSKSGLVIGLLLVLLLILGVGGYLLSRKKSGASGPVSGAATASASGSTAAPAVAPSGTDPGLVKAIEEGRLDDAKKLIAAGADVNAPNKNGITPLIQATQGSPYMPNNMMAVQLMLDDGAKVDQPDSRGRTPLDYAVEQGKEEIVKLLFDHKANVNAKTAGYTPLITAVITGKPAIMQFLLEHGADVDTTDSHGDTPLLIAAQGTPYLPNNVPLVEGLLAKGAKIEALDAAGRTPLYRAAMEAKNDALNILLDHKAEVNHRANDGSTAFLQTTTVGKPETMQILIKHGADVNIPDANNNTPLMIAAEGNPYMPNNVPEVTALLAAGAKVDAVDGRGRTAFYRAAAEGRTEAMKLLLAKKVDPNTAANDGSAPLLAAVQNDKLEAVKLLCETGANVNQADGSGTTPLMAASSATPMIKNPAELVKVLLAHGAKPEMTDSRGRTALALASESKNTAVIDLLKKK